MDFVLAEQRVYVFTNVFDRGSRGSPCWPSPPPRSGRAAEQSRANGRLRSLVTGHWRTSTFSAFAPLIIDEMKEAFGIRMLFRSLQSWRSSSGLRGRGTRRERIPRHPQASPGIPKHPADSRAHCACALLPLRIRRPAIGRQELTTLGC